MRPPVHDPTPPTASRRDALGLLASTPFLAAAQDQSSPSEEVRLLQNLLTRMGVEVRLEGDSPRQ
ncbi:hypothetical protein, partial [Nostoc sp. CCY 9925]|uniref:hypothetical protein n=1 Tax=Nostoc sp. CCY 9925 TaxID=3103865 RepID=UPI0039C6CDD1